LADDIAVGESNDEAVFGRIVLVLGLGDQTLTGIVIGLQSVNTDLEVALARSYLAGLSALVLGLVSGEVGRVLDAASSISGVEGDSCDRLTAW
jgi:hypothetical protein